MSVVLDASVTIARIHPEELTDAVVQVFDQVDRSGAVAPPFWKVEIANVLHTNVRKGRYDTAERDRLLKDVSSFSVTIDAVSIDQLWTVTIDLAHRHKLTVYDAIYLECAVRNRLPLATLDSELRVAATAEGISLLGL